MRVAKTAFLIGLIGVCGELRPQVFEWAVVEPINVSSNPYYLVNHVALDSSDFPV